MWFFKNSLLINPSICHWFVTFSLSHTNLQNILGMVFLAFLLCFFQMHTECFCPGQRRNSLWFFSGSIKHIIITEALTYWQCLISLCRNAVFHLFIVYHSSKFDILFVGLVAPVTAVFAPKQTGIAVQFFSFIEFTFLKQRLNRRGRTRLCTHV